MEICYIDFGNVEKERVADTRQLSQKMFSYPCQAVRCSLYGVEKRSEDTWETASNALKVLDKLASKVSMTIKDTKGENFIRNFVYLPCLMYNNFFL